MSSLMAMPTPLRRCDGASVSQSTLTRDWVRPPELATKMRTLTRCP